MTGLTRKTGTCGIQAPVFRRKTTEVSLNMHVVEDVLGAVAVVAVALVPRTVYALRHRVIESWVPQGEHGQRAGSVHTLCILWWFRQGGGRFSTGLSTLLAHRPPIVTPGQGFAPPLTRP